MTRHSEVFVFAFDEARAQFEGGLVGALERAESGGAIRVAEVLFVGRDGESGELTATRLEGGRGGFVGRMAEFRLDATRRSEQSKRTLEAPGAEALRELAATVEPGEAVAAILVEHPWVAALEDAVARSGGHRAFREPAAGEDLPDLAARALAARRGAPS